MRRVVQWDPSCAAIAIDADVVPLLIKVLNGPMDHGRCCH